MHKTVLITRYSLLTQPHAVAWRLGRQTWKKYRKSLFAPARLDLHERLFVDFVLPSIARQNLAPHPDWFEHLVLASSELPDPYMSNLLALQDQYPWLKVLFSDPDQADVNQLINGYLQERLTTDEYLTVRLDDDDILGVEFFKDLQKIANRFPDNVAISQSAGFIAHFNGSRFRKIKNYHSPNVALGLCFKHNMNSQVGVKGKLPISIYECGNHRTVDKRFPVILDSRRPSYLRVVHDGADTFVPRSSKLDKLEDADLERAVKHVPVIEGWL